MRAMDEEFITAHAKSLGIPSQNEKSCFSKRELWTALELKGVNRALDIIYMKSDCGYIDDRLHGEFYVGPTQDSAG
jgi:hypothetical protein